MLTAYRQTKQMNTKLLMAASALFMAIAGVLFSFLPHEILAFSDSPVNDFVALVFQLTGALYFGFAILNWMAKNNLIGGIYSRPLALGNFLHFVAGGLALLKGAMANGNTEIWVLAAVYLVFAALFGLVTFTHPKSAN
jgi:Na+-driven multidrug efflux pump